MLTCTAFYQLSYIQQADLLSEQGTFIQTRPEGNFIIDLFELDDLLIEIFYRKENDEPVSIMAYNTNEKLKSLQQGTLRPRLTIKKSPPLSRGSYAA